MVPAAAQTARTARTEAAPGTGTPQVAQRLLTSIWAKTIHNINIQANKTKTLKTVQQNITTVHKTMLELFYALQRSRGYKER